MKKLLGKTVGLIFSILILATLFGIQACENRTPPEKETIEYSGSE